MAEMRQAAGRFASADSSASQHDAFIQILCKFGAHSIQLPRKLRCRPTRDFEPHLLSFPTMRPSKWVANNGREAMFFLIRVAFWLSIVVILLPTGKTEQSATGPGAIEAFSAASAAVSDMRGFCERQPAACEAGSKAASAFGEKAQATAKMLFEYLTEQKNETAATDTMRLNPTSVGGRPSQNTLTAADRLPAWRGVAPTSSEPPQARRPS